jgi:hypothetical protein
VIDGAILFCGFAIKSADDLSRFTKAFQYPQPHQEVGLSGKRTTLDDNVTTANEGPPDVKFYYHNEYGRSAHFPGIVFFFSQQVPEQGSYPSMVCCYHSLEVTFIQEDRHNFYRPLS